MLVLSVRWFVDLQLRRMACMYIYIKRVGLRLGHSRTGTDDQARRVVMLVGPIHRFRGLVPSPRRIRP
jgi:hypothetical protein